MNRYIELLAPGGDIDSIKAAIAAGADAVYCGLDKFNARNRAVNIRFDDLNGILGLAHKNNCQVFLTLNTILVDSEIPAIIRLLNKLINTSIDGIIVQDLGLCYLLSKYFKRFKIHASTQFTTHNKGQIEFLSKLNATRVNLSRELNIHEIKALTAVAHDNNVLTEVFVHGSYCISFSGLCYMSSVHGGNSGNRGRCSQPCRDQYITTPAGKKFPLNLKDNSAFTDLREIADAGIDSIKIEGRIKKFHYVYTVIEAWRKQLDIFFEKDEVGTDNSALYKVFNRDFSNAFLKGKISKYMFIDNPRDNSALHLSEMNGSSSAEKLEKAKGDIFDERTEIIETVEQKINKLSILKAPLKISISGESGMPLKILVTTPDASFEVLSEIKLAKTGIQPLNRGMILSRLKALNDTEYFIDELQLENLQPDTYLPFKELTEIKNKLLFILNGSREFVDPIDVPLVKKQNSIYFKPALSVLISSTEDLHICEDATVTIYFQLPNSFKNISPEFTDHFIKNERLIPWFPAIIINDDYLAAVEFLDHMEPTSIVTDNTGIAFEAFKRGIPWIAGPSFNIVNSFGLLCLQENFNCSGAFISNEISKTQLKGIKNPADFKLFYSIYHPIVLMTSRQCLFHQVSGCEKHTIDDSCITECEKSTTLANLKADTVIIEKSKRNFHRIFNEFNYLNIDVITDIPGLFSGFMIDLRDIKTETKTGTDKPCIIRHFENLLNGNPDAETELKRVIYPTTNAQYRKGI